MEGTESARAAFSSSAKKASSERLYVRATSRSVQKRPRAQPTHAVRWAMKILEAPLEEARASGTMVSGVKAVSRMHG